MLKSVAVDRALPSLLGMALDYAPGLDRHDARRKVGIITSADLEDLNTGARKLLVTGYLFAQDFPELVREMSTATRFSACPTRSPTPESMTCTPRFG